jgi:hypothetical protein
MIHEEKLPEQVLMPSQLNKVTPEDERSPNNRETKNFIQRNIENLKYLKSIERRPWSQAGMNPRPVSMQTSYRKGT